MRISESVPLWLLYEDELDAWRATQSAFVRQWLIEQNFKGEKHRVLLMPDSGGALSFAIAGLGKRMRAGNGGSVINVLSGSGFLPVPGNLPYGSSKAALWMMTRYLAVECAPAVRVNALVPGLVMSETGGPKMSERIEKVFMPQIPMGRSGKPTEVAPAALYLASDASSYTTGTVLFANGGRPW